MDDEHVFFPSGDLRLEGLYCPGRYGRAVICHPHPQRGGSMYNNVVEAVTTIMLNCGLATLRFNFRGVGASEGSFGGGVDEMQDVKAAVFFMESHCLEGPMILAGYSFGAHVALRAGIEHSHVSGLVGIAPPVSIMDFNFLTKCNKRMLLVVGNSDQYCDLETLHRLTDQADVHAHYKVIASTDHFFIGMEEQLFSPITAFVAGSLRYQGF